MSVVVPKLRVRPADPLSVDEINANFYAIGMELDGSLGAHNFEDGAFVQDDVDEGGVYIWRYVTLYADPFFDWVNAPGAPPLHSAVNAYPAAVAIIEQQGAWVRVEGMVKTGVSAQGGHLWAIASFQHDHQSDVLTAIDVGCTPAGYVYMLSSAFNGALYAIRVNGTIVEESVLGSLDWSNDRVRHVILGDVEAETQVSASGGILWPAIPLVCDATVAIPPGTYTVELVVYVLPGTVGKRLFVSNREFMVLEVGK